MKNKTESKKCIIRNASLDLLRNISMFMIVIWHSLVHGGVINLYVGSEQMTMDYFIVILLMAFLVVHVNCFVLVSGYFLCQSEFKLSKVLRLWLEALFWSVLLNFLIYSVEKPTFDFSTREIIKIISPFTQDRYWFFTTYLLMYIISPACNVAIKYMSQRQHLVSILAFGIMFFGVDAAIYWNQDIFISYNNPLFFLFLYFVAAYFRLYPPKKRPWFLGYIACMLVGVFWVINIPEWLLTNFEEQIKINPFISYTSLSCVLGSIFFFLTFLQMNVKGIIAKISCAVAPLTFGIYLIHEHSVVRQNIWEYFKPYQYAESNWFIPILLLISAIVFVVCGVFESLRALLFKLLKIDYWTDLFADFVQKCCGKFADLLIKKL